MAKKRSPTRNVFWKDIPKGACVEDRGHLFVATMPGGKKAVAYWTGQDAREAQRTLIAMARRGCRRRR